MILTFGAAFLCGIGLITRGGWPVVAIGITSILFGILYTGGPKPLGYMGLGDVLVLLFFGPVATAGMVYINTLHWSSTAAILGIGLGLLSTAILVVNNLRDIVEDRSSGKNTLVARWGLQFGRWEYALCVIGGCSISSIWAVHEGRIWASVAAGIVALTSLRLIRMVWNQEGRALNPLLGQTGRLLLSLALGLSLGWVAG
jgi:1,4-dihydroxy-2-naphthoate octaprenyltransferase